jgi:hypothetical protein
MFDTVRHSGPNRPIAYLNGSVATYSTTPRARRSAEEARVALADPAVRVVTDFTWERPLTIAEERPIHEGLREMILAGVHSLLVMQGDVVTGLITSYDIRGERLVQFLRYGNYIRHDQIEVRQIMTPWNQVPTLDWHAVLEGRVANLIEFFRSTRATHAVIVEYADQGAAFVRGLISKTRLEHQLDPFVDR